MTNPKDGGPAFPLKRFKKTAICYWCNMPFICLVSQHDIEYGWVAKRCPNCKGTHNHSLFDDDGAKEDYPDAMLEARNG